MSDRGRARRRPRARKPCHTSYNTLLSKGMVNLASISKVVPWLLREDLVFGEGMGTQTGRPSRRSSRGPERQGAAWTKEQAMQMEREGGSEDSWEVGPRHRQR